VSALEAAEAQRAERRWVLVGLVVVSALFAAQVVAGMVREAVSNEPSYLEKVQTCLTERATPFQPVVGDPVALSAERGALRTTARGNPVTVALGGSEVDAARVYRDYVAVAPAGVVRTRLERHRKVVFLWDREPSTAQRDFMYLCTLDAQE
jgi:hypothetical protein